MLSPASIGLHNSISRAGVLSCVVKANLGIDQFLDSICIAYSASARMGLVNNLYKFRAKLPISSDHSVYFFCGQDNLLGGQFWAMDMFNLLGGQRNLQGGQMHASPVNLLFTSLLPPPPFWQI